MLAGLVFILTLIGMAYWRFRSISALNSQLGRSEKKYRELFNGSNDAIFVREYSDTAGFGKMLEVKRPMRLMANTTPMDKDKLKVDSDKALKAALKEPMLDKLTVKATEITLENDDNGPTWKITIWVTKLSDTTKLVDIGKIQVSAESGKILKNDLHLNRAS